MSEQQKIEDPAFEDWFNEVKELARIFLQWPPKTIELMDKDAWKDFYDDGYTPVQAWEEELSYE